jgi:hypothetical protein
MKKLLAMALALIMLFSFAACQSQGTGSDKTGSNQTGSDKTDTDKTGSVNLEGSLEEILDKIYETAELDAQFKEYIETGLMKIEITEENSQSYFNTDGIEFESGLASDPMMQPSAYLLTLIRVKEGADIEKIKSDIKENADPRRWVCVGVDPANVYVDNVGDVVMLVMSDNAGKALHEAFLALGK